MENNETASYESRYTGFYSHPEWEEFFIKEFGEKYSFPPPPVDPTFWQLYDWIKYIKIYGNYKDKIKTA